MTALRRAKHEFKVYRLIMFDSRTPKLAKLLLALAVLYAVSPIDVISDFILVLGFLDDLIIIPGLVMLALRFVPKHIVEECRMRAEAA